MVRYPSPLRYPGGKARLAPFLGRLIDKNFQDKQLVSLVEPFAGGAGASIALLLAGGVGSIVINDLDRAIYSFWKIAVTDTEYLIERIRRTPISVKQWHRQRAVYLDSNASQRDLAFATLYLNRTNRSGVLNGRPIGGLAQAGAWKLTARFTKRTIISRLQSIKKMRNSITVSNCDGIVLLRKLDKSKSRTNMLVFLDPPYFEQGSSLYLNHYQREDHVALANCLCGSKLNWIMTYDDNSYIRSLYRGVRSRRFSIGHSAQEHKIGREVAFYSDYINKVNI